MTSSARDLVTRWIVDPTGVEKGADKAEKAVKTASEKMAENAKKVDRQFDSIGKTAEGGGKRIKTAMDTSRGSLRGFEKGISVAAVASSGLQTSLSGAAREILLTGTALGFTGAALSAAGLAIGFLGRAIFSESEQSKRMRERMQEDTREAEKAAASLRARAVELDDQFRQSRGADLRAEKLAKLTKEAAKLDKQLARLKRDESLAMQMQNAPISGRFLEDIAVRIASRTGLIGPDLDAVQGKIREINQQIAANATARDAHRDIGRTENLQLADALKLETERANRTARATTEYKQFQVSVQRVTEELQKQGASARQIQRFTGEMRGRRQFSLDNQFAKEADALERQNALLAQSDPLARSLLAIDQNREVQMGRIHALAGNMTGEERERLTVLVAQNAEMRKQVTANANMHALAQQGGAAVERAIGDGIMAGVTGNREGFLNAMRGLASSTQRIFVDAFLESSGVKKGATAFFDAIFGVVNKSTGQQTAPLGGPAAGGGNHIFDGAGIP